VAHLSIGDCETCCIGFRLGAFCGLIGKELLYRMLWMMFSSFWYSSLLKSYEFDVCMNVHHQYNNINNQSFNICGSEHHAL